MDKLIDAVERDVTVEIIVDRGFCLRPDQWINRISTYSDGHRSWSNSIGSHRMVADPGAACDRWFGGYHEPNR